MTTGGNFSMTDDTDINRLFKTITRSHSCIQLIFQDLTPLLSLLCSSFAAYTNGLAALRPGVAPGLLLSVWIERHSTQD
jgi:hypothetical protein